MAQALPFITAGLGIFSAIKGLKKDKQPAQIAQPTAPTQDQSQDLAKEKARNRALRRSRTNVTGGALVPEINVAKKTLLGA